MKIGATDIVVLCGDSIMYQRNWEDLVAQANAKYGIGRGPIWLNGGQGGQTSTGGAGVIGGLVGSVFVPLRATKAIINWSINDVTTAVPLATSQANWATILTTTKNSLGAENILYLCPFITDHSLYAAMATYNAALQAACTAQGVQFVDLQALWLAREALGYRDPTLQPDLATFNRVHPQYTFMSPETSMTGKQIYASWAKTGITFV